MRVISPLPLPAKRAIHKLGRDIRDARRRRRISTAIMAQRARISRTTLNKIEKGDPAVAMGLYAAVLFVLGISERLSEISDVRNDLTGLALEDEMLPKRIRMPKSDKRRL